MGLLYSRFVLKNIWNRNFRLPHQIWWRKNEIIDSYYLPIDTYGLSLTVRFQPPPGLGLGGSWGVRDEPVRQFAHGFLLSPHCYVWSISYRFWVIYIESAFQKRFRPPIRPGYNWKYRFRSYRFVELQKLFSFKYHCYMFAAIATLQVGVRINDAATRKVLRTLSISSIVVWNCLFGNIQNK